MSGIEGFLGECVAKVVRKLIDRGHLGVRIQRVTAFDPAAMLQYLNSDPWPLVVVTDASVRELKRLTRYPQNLLIADLTDAADWRNDPSYWHGDCAFSSENSASRLPRTR